MAINQPSKSELNDPIVISSISSEEKLHLQDGVKYLHVRGENTLSREQLETYEPDYIACTKSLISFRRYLVVSINKLTKYVINIFDKTSNT
jgi:hypothetical protein